MYSVDGINSLYMSCFYSLINVIHVRWSICFYIVPISSASEKRKKVAVFSFKYCHHYMLPVEDQYVFDAVGYPGGLFGGQEASNLLEWDEKFK